jgi:SSS family solute:Na+ symporter
MIGDAFPIADIAVILAYFAILAVIGVLVSRRVESGEDLFLAGRSLRWPVIGGSLFASNISSTTLIGMTGAAYTTGIAVANYEWMAGLVLVFMAVFLIPVYLKLRITTVPEYLDARYGRPARLYFSAISIFLTLVVDTAGGIYAGAVVLRTFFPDLVLWQTCAALALVAGLYTAAGGLRAVVYTDVLQAAVLIVGSTILTLTVFAEFDFSWSEARAAIPDGHLSLIRPLDADGLPWLGTLVGVPLLGFWYWASNQYIAQRVLGADSLRDAQWGANLGGALKLLPLFIMVLPGAMAISLFPDIENGDRVFPTLVVEMLPVGVTGLVLAGLVAAIMSSIDSTLNSSSTLLLHDFVQREDKEIEPSRMARYGRMTTLGLMVLAAVWAPQIARFEGLFSYLQQAFSIVAPPVVAIFLFGIFSIRGGVRTAVGTLAIGHALGLALFVASQLGWWPLHFTINVGIMAVVSAVAFLALATREAALDDETAERATWIAGGPRESTADLPIYARPSVQGLVLVGITVVMVVAFW